MPSYPIKHGPAKIASTLLLPCLLILFASACDKEHQDDKALSEITQSIQLPSGEAQETPPASRLVITSEGTLYLDLGPLLARSARRWLDSKLCCPLRCWRTSRFTSGKNITQFAHT